MSTAERKAKEKEDLKALILKGAEKLFIEKGIQQTTIRSIADNIDYSIGTVYVYFKDKNAILHALHINGFTQLGNNFKVLHHVNNPMERLRAMGKVYIKFALENPDMYDLMFSMRAPMDFLESAHEDEWDEGTATFDVLRNTVSLCIDKGYFKDHDLEPLSFMIWSLVHGMCNLEIGKRTIGVNLKEPETIIERAYNEFLKIIDKL